MKRSASLLLYFLWLFASLQLKSQNSSKIQELFLLADTSLENGDYPQSLQYNLEAMQLAEAGNNCTLLADSYRRVGIVYNYLINREASLPYLYKSYHEAKSCQADTVLMRSARYLGAMYFGTQQADSAIHYLTESAHLMLKYGYLAEAASAYGMLGESYSQILHDLTNAEKNYRESQRLARLSGDPIALGYALFRFGCHLARNERCPEGRPLIDSSYVLFKQEGDMEGQKWALNGKAFAESRCGDPILVYTYMNDAQIVQDSIFRKETATQAAHFEALYEKEKQDHAIAGLQQKNRLQMMWLISGIGGVVLLAALGYLLINRRSLRKQQLAEQELYALRLTSYREVMDAENKERRRIASELHDSLGQLLSAARMNLSMVNTTDEQPSLMQANKVIDEAAREVRHISHNLMPASLQELGLPAALRQMARNMSPQGQPAIHLDLDQYLSATDDIEMSVYRMVQEMITNSIRHGKAGQIWVHLSCQQQMLHLSVKDNGTGMEVNRATDGIGLRNLRARTELMKGQLEIISESGKGTEVMIHLPL